MRTPDLSLPRRVADAVAWPFGLVYLAMVALAAATLREPSWLAGVDACRRLDALATPLWYCGDAGLIWFVANLANAAILLTVWLPALLAASLVDGQTSRIATPIVLFHVIGLVSAGYVMTHGGAWLLGKFRSRDRAAALGVAPQRKR